MRPSSSASLTTASLPSSRRRRRSRLGEQQLETVSRATERACEQRAAQLGGGCVAVLQGDAHALVGRGNLRAGGRAGRGPLPMLGHQVIVMEEHAVAVDPDK